MKNKYNNKKYYEDGEKFDSALERDVYLALIEKRKNGLISGLEFQKKFLLQDKFECDGVKYRKIEYIADFFYYENGNPVVVDAKGFQTDVYKLKKKMFAYKYNMNIVEITRKNFKKYF